VDGFARSWSTVYPIDPLAERGTRLLWWSFSQRPRHRIHQGRPRGGPLFQVRADLQTGGRDLGIRGFPPGEDDDRDVVSSDN